MINLKIEIYDEELVIFWRKERFVVRTYLKMFYEAGSTKYMKAFGYSGGIY